MTVTVMTIIIMTNDNSGSASGECDDDMCDDDDDDDDDGGDSDDDDGGGDIDDDDDDCFSCSPGGKYITGSSLEHGYYFTQALILKIPYKNRGKSKPIHIFLQCLNKSQNLKRSPFSPMQAPRSMFKTIPSSLLMTLHLEYVL